MSSIHTNVAAMTALRTKEAVSSSLTRTINSIATGQRISEASHNAAYWSVSVGMQNRVNLLSTVQDMLGFAAAMIDVSHAAMEETREILQQISARLLAAKQSGVDLDAIQLEVSQFADQTSEIADAAVFSDINWLRTDIDDLHEKLLDDRSRQLVSSISRSDSGGLLINKMAVDLKVTSLYNADGGGILQADPRSPGTIGGTRAPLPAVGYDNYSDGRRGLGSAASIPMNFTGPFTFGADDTIRFSLTVDADNPNAATNGGLPGPYDGGTTYEIEIDRALVDLALPGRDGLVSDYEEWASVVRTALAGTGVSVSFSTVWDSDVGGYVRRENYFELRSQESLGHDGSNVSIGNLDVTGNAGDFYEADRYGSLSSRIVLPFDSFKLFEDVEIAFDFAVNGAVEGSHVIDRDLIEDILGRDDGVVETAAEMLLLLESLVGRNGLLLELDGNSIVIRTDPADDRLNGAKTSIGFHSVSVNIEPIPAFGLLDIDVAANPGLVDAYIHTVEGMLRRTIQASALMGALKQRVDVQSRFQTALSDAFQRGIGQLVDTDMTRAAAKLAALQAQDELATQMLSIANSNQKPLLQLFGT
ncbi:hypothetical protein FY036_02885 [Mesorhizobium microcysteis]|uniref:Flagellin n=1 Tax=Neoaquamicrobium microcysteis TaxID=2682781 RepID=A0A5D4H712_9HYPH|nr:flagellin [Mesorhizobium microcysteis]TYR35235.1 hypothetical protein FY036_02885 [Mesorhizobium microcysteis]